MQIPTSSYFGDCQIWLLCNGIEVKKHKKYIIMHQCIFKTVSTYLYDHSTHNVWMYKSSRHNDWWYCTWLPTITNLRILSLSFYSLPSTSIPNHPCLKSLPHQNNWNITFAKSAAYKTFSWARGEYAIIHCDTFNFHRLVMTTKNNALFYFLPPHSLRVAKMMAFYQFSIFASTTMYM